MALYTRTVFLNHGDEKEFALVLSIHQPSYRSRANKSKNKKYIKMF